MSHQSHSVTGKFLDALYSNMFFPLIKRPTRITCHSATLIDNIFVNQFFDTSRSGLFFTDISDQLPISIHFDTSISASDETAFVRDVNQVNTTKFFSHLERIDWSQYGIRRVALDWVRSYLSNRLQFVQFNGQCSSPQSICCGVPQGSILGPLFFLLCINDLNNVSTLVKLILFANYTNLFMSHKDPVYLA